MKQRGAVAARVIPLICPMVDRFEAVFISILPLATEENLETPYRKCSPTSRIQTDGDCPPADPLCNIGLESQKSRVLNRSKRRKQRENCTDNPGKCLEQTSHSRVPGLGSNCSSRSS